MGNKHSDGVKCLMLGLDAAGKTTILYKLKLGDIIPVIGGGFGWGVETVTYEGIDITSWDAGGSKRFDKLYPHYYPNTKILIWVVDSNDKARMNLSKEELHKYLSAPELKDVIVLILANKQDLPNALSVEQVQDELEMVYYHSLSPEVLKPLAKDTLLQVLPDGIIDIVALYTPKTECRPYYQNRIGSQTVCRVMSCCAISGDGLWEAMHWLQSEIKSLKHSNCNIL